MDVFCAVCYELLIMSKETVFISCGHVFHSKCLLRWFRRSWTCPECREMPVGPPTKLYAQMDESTIEDSSKQLTDVLRRQIDVTKKKLLEYLAKVEESKQIVLSLKEKLLKKEASNYVLRIQYDQYCHQKILVKQLKERLHQYEEKFKLVAILERLLTSSACEVDVMMRGQLNTAELALFAAVLKKESSSRKDELNTITSALQECQHQVIQSKAEFNAYKHKLNNYSDTENKLQKCEDEKHSLLDCIKELERKIISLSKSEVTSAPMEFQAGTLCSPSTSGASGKWNIGKSVESAAKPR